MSYKRLIFILVSIFALASLSACGEEPGKKPPVIDHTQYDTGNQDAGHTDRDTKDSKDVPEADNDIDDTETGTDKDAGPNDGKDTPNGTPCNDYCLPSEICVDNACVADTAARKCADATDLGELKLGVKTTAEGTLFRTSDVLQTACGPAKNTLNAGAEAVFKFTVEQDARIDFKAKWIGGQFDGLVAFHTESCETIGSDELCFDHEEQSIYAVAGKEYFMIVELNLGRADDFTVDLTPNAIDCIPGVSNTTCTDNVYSRCEGIGITTDYNCADACATTGKECLGTSCNDAIVVTASTTFIGDIPAYKNTYDFQDIEGCEINGEAIPTPGPEVIFSLPNLTAGQVIHIDAATDDFNSNAIFITSNCGSHEEIQCVATDYFEERLTWTVPSNGDYFVFIAKDTGFGDHFNYSIDIQ